MPPARAAYLATAIFLAAFSFARLQAQELGPIQTFGANGRLFSSGDDDYFLLSRRTYATEDSTGYQGEFRILKRYAGGGYEIQMRDYTARCNAPFDRMVQVIWSTPGEESKFRIVDIKNPSRFPGSAIKDSYNLYWAACFGQFRRFK